MTRDHFAATAFEQMLVPLSPLRLPPFRSLIQIVGQERVVRPGQIMRILKELRRALVAAGEIGARPLRAGWIVEITPSRASKASPDQYKEEGPGRFVATHTFLEQAKAYSY